MNIRLVPALAAPLLGLAFAGFTAQADATTTVTGFDDGTLPAGWVATNLSTAAATGSLWNTGIGITDSSGAIVVSPHTGAGMAIVNYTSIGGSGSGTISNWLISPEYTTIRNGDTFSFWSTTVAGSAYPDRLEFRLSTSGATTALGTGVTAVGTFTTVLGTINPSLAVGGYPETWTQYSYTISGLTGVVDGRVALRYYVTNGGLAGANSNIIGVDDFTYTTAPVPEPETWALMFAGLGAVSWLARRKAAKQA